LFQAKNESWRRLIWPTLYVFEPKKLTSENVWRFCSIPEVSEGVVAAVTVVGLTVMHTNINIMSIKFVHYTVRYIQINSIRVFSTFFRTC